MNQENRNDREPTDGQGETGETRDSRETVEAQQPQPQPAGEERAVPPEELKPWYYQYWFLYPTIVFWPLWSVLIIRSPWHNGLVSGIAAWAYLIIFAGLAYVRIQEGGTIALSTIAVAAPGLILTIVTQAHWIRNRRRIIDAVPLPSKPAPQTGQPSGRRPRRANRRRGRRRR